MKSSTILSIVNVIEGNLPAIITGFISFCAIGLTYLNTRMTIEAAKKNLERQLKIQLATTVEKEWINNVRSTLIDFISHSEHFLLFYAHRKPIVDDDDLEKRTIAQQEFIKSKTTLFLSLNIENKLEDQVLYYTNEIAKLSGEPLDILTVQLPNLQFKIEQAAHKLFDSKKVE